MTTIFERIGEKISTWINDRGYTQKYLSDKLNVSPQVMSKIINGKKSINIIEIRQIADIMGISVDELIGDTSRSRTIEDPIMFMIGNLNNEKSKEKLRFLDHVMDEMIELENSMDKIK
ncbi:helix-turn-helix transcriptional regulator [Bacillaceae bacterium S4-13-58]